MWKAISMLTAPFYSLFALLALPPSLDFRFSAAPDSQHMVGGKFCEMRWEMKKTSGLFKLEDGRQEVNAFYSFYEPRRRGAVNSPIIIYFGEGPGLANSYQMMQAPGPCWVDEKKPKWPKDNYWSLNTWANVLYVDLPRTGFTQGTMFMNNREGTSKFMRNFIHRFYKEFPDFWNKHVYVWGVGYGAQFAITFAKESLQTHGKFLPIAELILDSPLLDLTTQYKAAIDHAHDNGMVKFISTRDRDRLKKEFTHRYEKRWTECSKDRKKECKEELREYASLWKRLVDGEAGETPQLDYKADPLNILEERTYWGAHEQGFVLKSSKKAARFNAKDWQWRMGLLDGKVNEELIDYDPFNELLQKHYWENGEVIRSSIEELQYLLSNNNTENIRGQRLRVTIMSGGANLLTNPLGINQIIEKLEFRRKEAFLKSEPEPIIEWAKRDGDRHLDAKQIGFYRESPNLQVIEFERLGFNIGKQLPHYVALLPMYFSARFHFKGLPNDINPKQKSHDLDKAANEHEG